MTPGFRNFGGQRSNVHIDFLVSRSCYNIETLGGDITRWALDDIERSRSPWPWINVKVVRKVGNFFFDWMWKNEENFFYFEIFCSTRWVLSSDEIKKWGHQSVYEIFGVEPFCVSGSISDCTRQIVFTFEQRTTIAVSRHHKKYLTSYRSRFWEKGVGLWKIPRNVTFMFIVRFWLFSSNR